MSRVFDGNLANFLEHSGYELAGTANQFTSIVWVKTQNPNTDQAFCAFGEDGLSNGQQAVDTSNSGSLRVYTNGAYLYSGSLAPNVWVAVIHRRRADGSQYRHELFNAGVVNPNAAPLVADEINGSALRTGKADLKLGKRHSGSGAYTGKLAHYCTFLRALSDTEISDVVSGVNPSSLNPMGRREYYPMVGGSLINEWADALYENPPALTMAGTVAVDAADNPTVSSVAANPAVSLDDSAFEPGKAITGTYANYASAPTVVTLTDSGGNTLTPAVTINDTAKTFSTAYPARITTGTGTTLLRGSVTVELT